MRFLIVLALLLIFSPVICQRYTIIADRLIDCKQGNVISQPTIVIETNKIVEVHSNKPAPEGSVLIDLRGFTLLPGLMDVHTHILSNGTQLEEDLYQNSSAYRSLRAVQHLSTALQNGFTTMRDLCTEGAGFADVDISRAIDSGFITGPRLFTSGRGIAATDSYLPRPRKQNWEIKLPAATQYASGKEECLKAVREQSNRNIRWIKLFADWGNDPTFSFEELQAVMQEAARHPLPVAVHAKSRQGIRDAIIAGARSVEHGNAFDDSLIQLAVQHNVFWCPTVSWEEYFGKASTTKYDALKRAVQQKLKVVCGTDAGGFPWQVKQAKELEYYVKKGGLSTMQAIQTATKNAAELLGIDMQLGSIEKGFIADIIAVKGNPVEDITALQRVVFVMKEGKVYKTPEK